MNILNLNEGSFPINLLLEFEDVDIPNIGKLKKKLNMEISKNGYLTYKSKESEWIIENEFDLCNEKEFKPKIVLKRSE